MKTKDNINYEAESGKVFVRKSDGIVMGHGLGLCSEDSIDNYEEIDCPDEYRGRLGYDNYMGIADPIEEQAVIGIPTNKIPS